MKALSLAFVADYPLSSTEPAVDQVTRVVDINALPKSKRGKRPLVGWLVAMNGPHKGKDFRLYDGKNVIGTAAHLDIVITDPFLSATHAVIRHEEGNYMMLDLDSTNGSFVNNERVRHHEMISNDRIRIGRTNFRFKALWG